jgi:glutamine amidotransferase
VLNLNTPILGICLGMQLLADYGFEGTRKDEEDTPGLCLVPGSIEILPADIYRLRLPHVGWNDVSFSKPSNGLIAGINSNSDFYFVHSYFFKPTNNNVIIGECNYGINFPAVIQHQNIFGVQFHPEKSSKAGLQILKNFIEQV